MARVPATHYYQLNDAPLPAWTAVTRIGPASELGVRGLNIQDSVFSNQTTQNLLKQCLVKGESTVQPLTPL